MVMQIDRIVRRVKLTFIVDGSAISTDCNGDTSRPTYDAEPVKNYNSSFFYDHENESLHQIKFTAHLWPSLLVCMTSPWHEFWVVFPNANGSLLSSKFAGCRENALISSSNHWGSGDFMELHTAHTYCYWRSTDVWVVAFFQNWCWSGIDFWTYQCGPGIGYLKESWISDHGIGSFKKFSWSLVLVSMLGPRVIFGWYDAGMCLILKLV